MNSSIILISLWIGLALISTIISSWFNIATALSEILVGIAAQFLLATLWGLEILDPRQTWIQILGGTGAILLTFLAGTELDPKVFRLRWKETSIIGITSFIFPFLGCAGLAYYIFHWSISACWLSGIALSTTSVAVVYAVMLELGLNVTEYGKTILAACFITDLGTVMALGIMFAPFTTKTIIFIIGTVTISFILPPLSKKLFQQFGSRPSEFETKFILFFLFSLGALAIWSGSEAVLPAYIMGMIMAQNIGKDNHLICRLRTLTFGFLTPFYFLRVGSYVSVPAVFSAPLVISLLFLFKVFTKIIGVYPVTIFFGSSKREGIYTTLLMSTGLTFGSIAALYGLSHNIIDEKQYSYLVSVVVASAIIPTIIANFFFIPHHRLSKRNLTSSQLPKENAP